MAGNPPLRRLERLQPNRIGQRHHRRTARAAAHLDSGEPGLATERCPRQLAVSGRIGLRTAHATAFGHQGDTGIGRAAHPGRHGHSGAGPNLTYVGSLANLLWRSIVRRDIRAGFVEFTRIGLLTTPITLVIAVLGLWVGLRVFGV